MTAGDSFNTHARDVDVEIVRRTSDSLLSDVHAHQALRMLKEELFELEVERKPGKITAEEYD